MINQIEMKAHKSLAENVLSDNSSFISLTDDNAFADLVEASAKQYFRKQHKIFYISTFSTIGMAAVFLIGIIAFRPLERIRINNYASMVATSQQKPIQEVIVTKGNEEISQPTIKREFRFVNNEKLDHQYFIKDNSIYMSVNNSSGQLFMQMNNQSQMDYYYLINPDKLYKLDLSKSNRIQELAEISDKNLLSFITSRPQDKIKINQFASMVAFSSQKPVQEIVITRGNGENLVPTTNRKFCFVNESKMDHHYFIKDKAIYMSVRDSSGHLYMQMNDEAKMDYFYLIKPDKLYKLNLNETNCIYELENLQNPDLLNYFLNLDSR